MQHVQGWVEQGNTHVFTQGMRSATVVQGSFPLSTVTVFNAGTTTLASIFSDNNQTVLGNPFTADAAGNWGFFVASGLYDVQFSGDGLSAPFTIHGAGSSISSALGPLFVNVQDFGALGNGVHDDTLAIQAAINACNPGGEVFVPAGTYLITAALRMFTNPVNLVGAGRNVTIIYAPNGGYDGINPGSNCRIAHMTIRGPSSTSGLGGLGVDAGSTNYLTLEDLIVEQWSGTNINSGGSSSYWAINNVISRNSGDEGLLITAQSNYWHIANFTVYGNRHNGIDMSGTGHTLVNITTYQNGGTGSSAGGDQDGLLIVADQATVITRDITITNLYTFLNNSMGVRIQTTPATVIQRVSLTNVVAQQNGQGDGGTNPVTRSGDGIAIVNSPSTALTAESIQDLSIVNAKLDNNYRFGISIQSNDGNPNPVQRISIAEVQTVNHTGWTGNFTGGSGAVGLWLYGSNLIDIKIRGQSLFNTSNIFLASNIPSGQTEMQVQTNDTGSPVTWSTGPAGTGGTLGARITSSGNTQITWHSTVAGAHDYTWFVDATAGNFDCTDLTSGALRIAITPSLIELLEPLMMQSAGAPYIQFHSTAGGSYRDYRLQLDSSGNFIIYDVVAGSNRLLISSTGDISLSGALNLAGRLGVGGGSTISKIVTAAIVLNFPATAAGAASELTNSAPGMLGNFPTVVSPDPGTAGSAPGVFVATCRASDNVTVRYINTSAASFGAFTAVCYIVQFQF